MNGIATVVPDDNVALPFKDLIAFGLDTLPIGVLSAITVAVAVAKWEGYGKLCDPDNEPLPCPLQTSQHGQIGAEIVAGRGLDVAVTELSRDH